MDSIFLVDSDVSSTPGSWFFYGICLGRLGGASVTPLVFCKLTECLSSFCLILYHPTECKDLYFTKKNPQKALGIKDLSTYPLMLD